MSQNILDEFEYNILRSISLNQFVYKLVLNTFTLHVYVCTIYPKNNTTSQILILHQFVFKII